MIGRVQIPTGGSSFAWTETGDAVYYRRDPRPGERPDEDLDFYQQIYLHRIGQPESEDTYVVGKDFPKIAECVMETTLDGRYLLLLVRNGDGGEVGKILQESQ